RKGVASDIIDEWMEPWLERLGDIFPSYAGNVRRYLAGESIGKEFDVPPETLKAVMGEWYQGLIRGRREDDWPIFCGDKLKEWYLVQRDTVVQLDSEMDYRNTVLYLPVFSAAVASGDARVTDVFDGRVEEIFLLRKVRDFDAEWFNRIYQYCLLKRII